MSQTAYDFSFETSDLNHKLGDESNFFKRGPVIALPGVALALWTITLFYMYFKVMAGVVKRTREFVKDPENLHGATRIGSDLFMALPTAKPDDLGMRDSMRSTTSAFTHGYSTQRKWDLTDNSSEIKERNPSIRQSDLTELNNIFLDDFNANFDAGSPDATSPGYADELNLGLPITLQSIDDSFEN